MWGGLQLIECVVSPTDAWCRLQALTFMRASWQDDGYNMSP